MKNTRNIKTSELRKGMIVNYYGAEFEILTNAIESDYDKGTFIAECKRVDNITTSVDDILDKYNCFKGNDLAIHNINIK